MTNPLIDLLDPPGQLPAFADILPEHVVPAIDQLLEEYRAGLAQITAGPSDWQHVVDAENRLSDRLSRAFSAVSHLSNVRDSDALREAYADSLRAITRLQNERSQDEQLYQAYRSLADDESFKALDPARQRLVQLELRDFHRAGVDLDEAQRTRYRELVESLTELSNRFSDNVLDATNGWKKPVGDVAELAGLPQNELDMLAGLARDAGQEGWLVNLTYPSFSAVMTYAEDRELREEVYQAYVTRASDAGPNAGRWDNGPLIGEILQLRHELAQLLGYSDYLDYALDVRMVENRGQVGEFLDTLASQARPVARQQFSELCDYAREQGGPEQLQPWDLAYWSEKLRQARYAISDELLRPYFPAPQVTEGLFEVVYRLYGIRLRENPAVPTWHADAKYVDLLDEQEQVIGGIYLDLYARDEKRGGAWMDVCQSRMRQDGALRHPVAFLNCNFPRPGQDRPALLNFNDVETLFHEAGHCLHHLLTRIDFPQINGISNVEWDAVELPSQILENWCMQREVLDLFARHYETGEPLPEALFDKLYRSRHFQKAMQLVRQLEFALVDLELHASYDPQNPPDPLVVLEGVRERVAVTPSTDYNRFLNSFTHLFAGGYAAGYYSYLWAEQLSEDAFQRFVEAGLFDADTGRAFREEVLAVGSSRPAMDSFRAFRGRPPVVGPLLASYDVAVTSDAAGQAGGAA